MSHPPTFTMSMLKFPRQVTRMDPVRPRSEAYGTTWFGGRSKSCGERNPCLGGNCVLAKRAFGNDVGWICSSPSPIHSSLPHLPSPSPPSVLGFYKWIMSYQAKEAIELRERDHPIPLWIDSPVDFIAP